MAWAPVIKLRSCDRDSEAGESGAGWGEAAWRGRGRREAVPKNNDLTKNEGEEIHEQEVDGPVMSTGLKLLRNVSRYLCTEGG